MAFIVFSDVQPARKVHVGEYWKRKSLRVWKSQVMKGFESQVEFRFDGVGKRESLKVME